ncbi:hypothetical protein [Saccharothrix sp. Mg75]|uniref:hypothetical protein n=1 Tax=Saccharothrix sp. Mg75 TaxID=3445357 RepID=UPI003EEDEB31
MTAILTALAVLALVVYGLERNHTTHRAHLAGSTDVDDRDLVRLRADLRAAAVRTEPARPAPRTRTTSSAQVACSC